MTTTATAPTSTADGATWDLSILYDNPDDPKIAADLVAAGLRSSSILPATRISAEGVAARAPDLPPKAPTWSSS